MRLAALLILALAAVAAPSRAQLAGPADKLVVSPWKQVGNWGVAIDGSTGNGCFTMTAADGLILSLGYNATREVFVALSHETWTSFEPGKTYPMVVAIDDQQYPGSMEGFRAPTGRMFVRRFFSDATLARRFLTDIQRGNRFVVLHEGRQLAVFSLRASQMAVAELDRCQATQDKPGDAARPPGAPPPPPGSLPALTVQQRLDTMQLAVNVLARLPGLRILSEEETKALALTLSVSVRNASVAWRTESVIGLIHLLPDATAQTIAQLVARLTTGMAQACAGKFELVVEIDQRLAPARRIHTSCSTAAGAGVESRVILMPFKGGVFYLSVGGKRDDSAAITRTEELLRNALFEVAPK